MIAVSLRSAWACWLLTGFYTLFHVAGLNFPCSHPVINALQLGCLMQAIARCPLWVIMLVTARHHSVWCNLAHSSLLRLCYCFVAYFSCLHSALFDNSCDNDGDDNASYYSTGSQRPRHCCLFANNIQYVEYINHWHACTCSVVPQNCPAVWAGILAPTYLLYSSFGAPKPHSTALTAPRSV